MNLVQLKYFCAVCTYGTVSQAAEFLHISQPSVSSAIKELEAEFKVILFRRHRHGMTLTPAGETLLKMSRSLLSQSKELKTVMSDLGGERKTLRLGIPPMIGSLLLPRIYDDFVARNGEIVLEITEEGRSELLNKLSGDYLDMVLLPHDRHLEPELSSLHISSLEIVCCVGKDNPLAKYKNVSADDLKDIPLVLFKNSFFQTEKIRKWFAAQNVKPDIMLQTEQLSTVLSLVSSNIAAGFMFKELIDASPALVAISTQTPIFADISLVWRKGVYFSGCMSKFKNYVKNERILTTP